MLDLRRSPRLCSASGAPGATISRRSTVHITIRRAGKMKRRSVRRGLLAGVVIACVTTGVFAAPGSGQSEAPAIDAARFSLTIDGFEIASFSELAGITTEIEPADYMVSSDKEVILKRLPGALHPPSIVLKRGLSGGMELWAWHQ